MIGAQEMMKIYDAEATLNQVLDVRKWATKVPRIELPEGYMFRPSPNFAGTIARFHVSRIGGEKEISVYLDCNGVLGHWEGPYWEMYPYDYDVRRFEMHDTQGLVESIVKELGAS